MSTSKPFAGMQNPEDNRVCLTIIGFVYSPLLLLLGAAALIGLA